MMGWSDVEENMVVRNMEAKTIKVVVSPQGWMCSSHHFNIAHLIYPTGGELDEI